MKKKLRGVYISIRVRDVLGITNNEAVLLDSVFKLQNNHKHPGWCFANREYLCKAVGVTLRSLFRMQKNLVEKGLLEVRPKDKYLKTTQSYSELAHFESDEKQEPDLDSLSELKNDIKSVETMTKSQSSYDKKSYVYRKDIEIDKENEEKKNNNKKREYFSKENSDKELKRHKSLKEYRKEACRYYPTGKNTIDKSKGIYYSWIAFKQLYELYPDYKRGSMKNAFASWHERFQIESEEDLISKHDLIKRILKDISSRQNRDMDWERGAIPKLVRYIKEALWEDEFDNDTQLDQSQNSLDDFDLSFFEQTTNQTNQTLFKQ